MAARRQSIADFQQVLLNSGFNPGVIDGKWGSNTRGAMNQYQESRGIKVSTFPGPLTVNTLNSESPGRENPPIILNYQQLIADIKAYVAEKKSEQATGIVSPEDPAITQEEMSVVFPEEKKSMPWWGWLLIGGGVVGAVVGGVYLYRRYGKKRGGSSYSDLDLDNDDEGLTCALSMTQQEKATPKFKWGTGKKTKK